MSTPRLLELTLPAAITVCRGMRSADVRCIAAARGPGFDRDEFAVDRWQSRGPAWVLEDAGGPLAIGGLQFTTAWTGCMWLVAHERANSLPRAGQSWRKLVAATRTVISNALDPANEHARRRVEAQVLSGWPEAQRLVRHLGFRHEGTCRQAGSGGEDIEIWAQVAEGN